MHERRLPRMIPIQPSRFFVKVGLDPRGLLRVSGCVFVVYSGQYRLLHSFRPPIPSLSYDNPGCIRSTICPAGSLRGHKFCRHEQWEFWGCHLKQYLGCYNIHRVRTAVAYPKVKKPSEIAI